MLTLYLSVRVSAMDRWPYPAQEAIERNPQEWLWIKFSLPPESHRKVSLSLSLLSLGGLGLDVTPSTVAGILFLVQGWSQLQQRECWRTGETWVFSVINQPWNPQNSRLPVQWDNCLSCGRILDSFRFFISMETKCKSPGFRGQTQN